MHVAAVGDNCLDVYVEQNRVAAGGNALNVAANWALGGLSTTYVGAVGSDREADLVADAMLTAGLETVGLDRLPGATAVTLLRLVHNDREFLLEDFGVGEHWIPSQEQLNLVAASDWVHVAGPIIEQGLAQRLAATGLRTSVDLSTTRDFGELTGIEVAFLSWPGPRDNASFELARAACEAGAATAVVTCGPHGSLAVGSHEAKAAAQGITPVDTCGAGDSFIAGFVRAHLHDADLYTCLSAATRAATSTCLHLGGFPQQRRRTPPWLNERLKLGSYVHRN
jgi:fructoselysine 6-kinase